MSDDAPTKNCHACSHSYMEPDSPLICGHKDSGSMGTYSHIASVGLRSNGQPSEDPRARHCGPERTKFEQHPLRNPDGSLP